MKSPLRITESSVERNSLKSVTQDNEADIRADGRRIKREKDLSRYWWVLALIAGIFGVLIGVLASDGQVDDLLSNQAAFDERLSEMNNSFEAERSALQAEITRLEDAVSAAPSFEEVEALHDELDQVRTELGEAEEVHAAEVLELQRNNAGLRAHNDELVAQNQALQSQAAQASSAQTRAESALTAELGSVPQRIEATLRDFKHTEEYRVNEVFSWTIYGPLDVTKSDDRFFEWHGTGEIDYQIPERFISAQWQGEPGEDLVVRLPLPQVVDADVDPSSQRLPQEVGSVAAGHEALNDETALQPLFDEVARRLMARGCENAAPAKEFIADIEDMLSGDMTAGHDPTIIWLDTSGQPVAVSDSTIVSALCP